MNTKNSLPLLILVVLTLGFCRSSADVAFVNGWTNTVYVSGAAQFQLLPGQSLSFVPASTATNEIDFEVGGGGANLDLQDGVLYSVNEDGSVTESPVLRSAVDDDAVLASYFTRGLESGTALGALLFGWMAIKRVLRLGDTMPE